MGGNQPYDRHGQRTDLRLHAQPIGRLRDGRVEHPQLAQESPRQRGLRRNPARWHRLSIRSTRRHRHRPAPLHSKRRGRPLDCQLRLEQLASTRSTDPVGRLVTLAYNATSGKISSIQDWAGRITSLTVNSSGNLASITSSRAVHQQHCLRCLKPADRVDQSAGRHDQLRLQREQPDHAGPIAPGPGHDARLFRPTRP